MKTIISVILVLALLATSLCGFPTVFSAYIETDDGFTYTISYGLATITDYSGEDAEVIVPSVVDGYNVVAVVGEAFRENTAVRSIIIPEGVERLGKNLFYGCTALESVTLPSSLKKIGASAFDRCKNLKTIIIFDLVAFCNIEFAKGEHDYYNDRFELSTAECYTSNPLKCGNCFVNNSQNAPSSAVTLCTVTADGNVTTDIIVPAHAEWADLSIIDEYKKAKRIVFEDGITSIQSGFLYESMSYNDGEAVIPASVTDVIGGYFYAKTILYRGTQKQYEAIKAGNLDCKYAIYGYGTEEEGIVYSFDDETMTAKVIDFNGTSQAKSIVIPEKADGYTVTEIASNAFSYNTVIESVEIPGTVGAIEDLAFSGCTSLESVALGEGIENIWRNAFDGCTSLERINLPSTLKNVDYKAFYKCNALKEVNYNGTRNEFSVVNVENGNDALLSANITYLKKILPGDMDGDGAVTVKDLNYIKRVLAGALLALPESDMYTAADTDENGTVNAMDSNAMKRAFVGVGN